MKELLYYCDICKKEMPELENGMNNAVYAPTEVAELTVKIQVIETPREQSEIDVQYHGKEEVYPIEEICHYCYSKAMSQVFKKLNN